MAFNFCASFLPEKQVWGFVGPSKALENFFQQRRNRREKRVRALLHSIGRGHGAYSGAADIKDTAKPLNGAGSKNPSHRPNTRP